MLKEAGLVFGLKALALNYILGVEIMVSALYALMAHFFFQKETVTGEL